VSNRIVAALGAATLTVGILVGAAGTIIVENATTPDQVGMHGTAGAMVGGSMMSGSMMSGANADDMAEWHAQHHGTDR
jgi:hypothetical protein